MSFPKLIKVGTVASETLKTGAAIGAIVVAGETYQQTGNWMLAVSVMITALLSGNVVTRKTRE